MCLRRLQLRLWHQSVTLLKTGPSNVQPWSPNFPVRRLVTCHRHLASVKGTALAVDKPTEDPNEVKDPPVIYLADSKQVLDLDKPDHQKQWHNFASKDRKDVSANGESEPSTEKKSVTKDGFGKDWKLVDGSPELRQLPQLYLQLSKFRLTMLVAATSAGGYGMVNTEVKI